MPKTEEHGYEYPEWLTKLDSFVDQSWGNDTSSLLMFRVRRNWYGLWVGDSKDDYDMQCRFMLIGPYTAQSCEHAYEAMYFDNDPNIVIETDDEEELARVVLP